MDPPTASTYKIPAAEEGMVKVNCPLEFVVAVDREEALPASMRATEDPEIGESPPFTVPLTLKALPPLLELLVPELVPTSELDFFPQELNKRETEKKIINKIPNFFMPIFFITENPPSGKNLFFFSARDEDSPF